MEFEKEQVWQRLASNGEYTTYYAQADESERESFRAWLKSLLRSQAVLIEFVKANGETRVMRCTLSEQLGVQYADNNIVEGQVVAKPVRKVNTDACAVWDLNQSAWRSFRCDRVKKIEFEIG